MGRPSRTWATSVTEEICKPLWLCEPPHAPRRPCRTRLSGHSHRMVATSVVGGVGEGDELAQTVIAQGAEKSSASRLNTTRLACWRHARQSRRTH